MIYDPITRQTVEIIGRFPEQDHCFRFGKKVKGTTQFVLCRYGATNPHGGFPEGTERECDVNDLRADDGILEINKAYKAAPELAAR